MDFIVKFVKKIFTKLGLEIRKTRGRAPDLTSFRKQIYESTKGILHIGGHRGQEATVYERAKARVIWFEALEGHYLDLKKNIKDFPKQQAVHALLGDEEKIVNFHLSSNDGMSSSIYPLAEKNGFDLSMVESVPLKMKRLDSLLTPDQAINYPHWVIDVQGAELSVLQGAGRLLESCHTIDVEVSTFDVYEGGVRFTELDKFLRREGFLPLWQPIGRTHEDLIYIRARPSYGGSI